MSTPENSSGKRRGKRFLFVRSLTNQAVIADKCIEAVQFLDRLVGLIGKKDMPSGEAMFFPRCNDIHMWFMSIPIDVVFLVPETREGRQWRVTSVRTHVRPWRALPLRDGKAKDTLELPAGSVERFKISVGDRLCID